MSSSGALSGCSELLLLLFCSPLSHTHTHTHTHDRKKYMKDIEASTGDENLILAEIDASVGYGVFAGKDYQPGSYICRYGGRLSAEGAYTSSPK